MKHIKSKINNSERGSILIYELVLIFVLSVVIMGLLSTSVYYFKVLRSTGYREQAFHIAEAGINYYQWHLAHFPTDYQDGTGQSGPYVHDYVDADTQQVLGQYSLNITPPVIGSTLVTISSTGWTTEQPNIRRTVTVRYGIPSLAKYGFLTNSYIHIGSTSVFNGEFHSNSGVQFDGTGNAPITSARQTYNCSGGSNDDCSGNHNGIWGSAPASTQAYWQYPVPNVDYSAITADMASIKTAAQTNGKYLAPSNDDGYRLVFLSDGTYRVYRVTSLQNDPTGYDATGASHSENVDYQNSTQLSTTCNPYPCAMPANGVIFVEDKVWVEGTVNGRVLVAAGILPYNPATAPSIHIQNNIIYAAQDGNDVLGLIAQQNVLITHDAPSNLTIHGALIAQYGAFQRYRYPNTLKNTLAVYGSISSYGRAAIYYGDSGYQTRNYTYDGFLLYGPPPSFPLSSSDYQQISWTSD